ncbi:hypothetical protein EK21DRAFT_93432 [Setomelanomma holmii]|uniref:Uncharacterized protein n=1 Tax=Setomelanomma holmii TaxID=210430 RepID=A0A9P4GZW9_9PLEO|nr:hypothetical protein EK21DRAFT_93432 [Setomelanomma holmii]
MWVQKCGEQFFGDVVEYREGGIARLITRMRSAMSTKGIDTPHDSSNPNQNRILRSGWIRRTFQKLATLFGSSRSPSPSLPQHHAPCTASGCIPTGTNPTPGNTLHLMACMQRGRYQQTVQHHRIDGISTDKELFCFIRRQLCQRWSRFRRLFSLKCVQGLYFVKFRLWAGGSAENREHEPCCTSSASKECECIPPASKVEPAIDAEYRCKPAGPLDAWPPVLSQQLMHMLTDPECIHKEEMLVLEKLPKRTCRELQGKVRQPAEGWGIHFQEGWDTDILIGVVAIIFAASLLFAILWSYFEHDIQGAFGVSSYMITAVGVLVALIVNRAGRLG